MTTLNVVKKLTNDVPYLNEKTEIVLVSSRRIGQIARKAGIIFQHLKQTFLKYK